MTIGWIISLRAADFEALFEARVVVACEMVRTRKASCQGALAFDRSLAFDCSPEYMALKPIRDKSTRRRSMVVEGLPSPRAVIENVRT
jgi:hypothetical protein